MADVGLSAQRGDPLMPTRAPRACACGRLRPCSVHVRKPWDHKGRSRQKRGLGAEYDRNRAIVLRDEKTCGICGGPGLANDTVDHIVQRSQGGTSELVNLRRAHKRCNLARRIA
jgi:5-methylcytosine-specific restriction endonuclease McrA